VPTQSTSIVAALALLLGTAAAAEATDWPTYGFDSVRSGANPVETTLSAATVPALRRAWAFDPVPIEQLIDPSAAPASAVFQGQPIVASGVPVNGTGLMDLLFVGDDNGNFFALDANTQTPTGTVVWARPLGRLIEPGATAITLGVRSAAAVDRDANGGRGAVYIGLNGRVHAMDLATGAELRGWPVSIPNPGLSTDSGFVHDGINVVAGKLYVGTSSNEERPPWFGRLIRIDTATAKLDGLWYTLTGTTQVPPIANNANSGGGIWSGGGVSVDPTAKVGGVYVATGNAKTLPNERHYAEQVLNLSTDLFSIVSFAAPALPAGDFDYGSTPVVFKPAGCATKLLAVMNKSGLVVTESIAANGTLHVVQSLRVANTAAMVGNAAWDAADQLLFLATPADGPGQFKHGLVALKPLLECSGFAFAWGVSANAQGTPFHLGPISSPTIANGLVYFADAAPNAQVFAVATHDSRAASAGQILWQSTANPKCHSLHPLSAPAVVNGRVFVACKGETASIQAFALPSG
jgi:hypothetical protein